MHCRDTFMTLGASGTQRRSPPCQAADQKNYRPSDTSFITYRSLSVNIEKHDCNMATKPHSPKDTIPGKSVTLLHVNVHTADDTILTNFHDRNEFINSIKPLFVSTSPPKTSSQNRILPLQLHKGNQNIVSLLVNFLHVNVS